MDTSGRYSINLRDLSEDRSSFSWHLDDAFFGGLDEQEIKHGSLDATLRVNRKSGAYELCFHVKGDIIIPCDRCLEPMTQAIDTEATVEARLGDRFEDDGEMITVPEESGELDVAWNLYETIALAIPIYHVHPDGGCSDDVNALFLEKEPQDKPTDTRWDALKALLDNSKN